MFKIWVVCCFAIASAVSDSPSVIIIGAGPSGIAAATKLFENGITNLTILEAEDRIGGRIYSHRLADGFIDIGAEFCHGEVGNVVFESVKNLSLLNREDFTFDLYYSDGSKIDEGLRDDFVQLANTDLTSEGNIEQNIMKIFNSTLLKKYKTTKKPNVSTDLPKLLEHMLISLEGAFSWDRPVANGHYTPCPGNQQLTWKSGGFHTILDVLMKKIPNREKELPLQNKIFLNREVTEISWEEKKAVVKTNAATEHSADYVIFTPSIGVLKHNHGLFKPALPKKKLDALDALGFDAIMKINIDYNHKWWDRNTFFVWSAEDIANAAKELPQGYEGYSENGISWVTSVFGFSQAANPNGLVAWVSGPMVPHIEQMPDYKIREGIHYVTNKFLGKQFNATYPNSVIKSQWYSNPHFRGTYSYEKNDHYKKDVSNQALLAEPLLNGNGEVVVQFAGEATNSKHFSTVHGAIETGWREADRIISLNQKQ